MNHTVSRLVVVGYSLQEVTLSTFQVSLSLAYVWKNEMS